MVAALIGVSATLFVTIVGWIFSWGKMTQRMNGLAKAPDLQLLGQKVDSLANDVSHIRKDISKIYARLDEHGERIAKVEARLEAK